MALFTESGSKEPGLSWPPTMLWLLGYFPSLLRCNLSQKKGCACRRNDQSLMPGETQMKGIKSDFEERLRWWGIRVTLTRRGKGCQALLWPHHTTPKAKHCVFVQRRGSKSLLSTPRPGAPCFYLRGFSFQMNKMRTVAPYHVIVLTLCPTGSHK